jgi:hypothetical protein
MLIAGYLFSEQDTQVRIGYTVPNEKLRQGVDMLVRLAKTGELEKRC